MACRGVHFALTDEQYKKVKSISNDDELIDLIQEEIEEDWDEDWLRETDKAWDAIHRCLTDGSLSFDSGPYPLSLVILGGKQLHQGDDYIISLVEPEQVKDVAKAICDVDKDVLYTGYKNIKQVDYDGEIGEEDFDYTWSWFKELPSLFIKAAKQNRAVLFTVDQ
jgi:hypothetical protein